MAQQIDNTKKLKSNVLDEKQYGHKGLYLMGLVLGLWGPFVAATIILFFLVKVYFRIETWVDEPFQYLIK